MKIIDHDKNLKLIYRAICLLSLLVHQLNNCIDVCKLSLEKKERG